VRILLDNCVPRRFGRRLAGHSVEHAAAWGWAELSNGDLLRAAAAGGFDVLLTVDRNLAHQQKLGDLPLPVLVVFTHRNSDAALSPMVPKILAVLGQQLQKRIYTTEA
jgi:predicted nuclease of predicted toxin-antitoxin system